jgi:cyclopropane fatty-acyl-phospholipid synthase-like methyltransferase
MNGRSQLVERDWQSLFQETYAGPPSRVAARIWADVLGDEYPAAIDPHSFTTISELRRFVRELDLRPGETLVDVGCGRGGPGLWVASASGARLVGLDIAENALEAARARAALMGVTADFRLGSFEATGLRDESAHAVMSIDALLFAPSKTAALVELRRILRPGGRLVFTSFDYHRQPIGRPPQVDDHRPLLRVTGFDVRGYSESPAWRIRAERIYGGLLAAVDELAAESGEPVDEVRRDLEEEAATADAMTRRFMAVAVAH